MSDNLHTFNDEVLEQDQIVTDLTDLTTRVGTNETDITTINNLNIANKFAGSVSSGLKTLIEGNDTDIQNIETKTDLITISNAINMDDEKALRITNTSKNSYPSGDATKVGNISVSSAVNLNTMNTSITTNTNAIDAIEVKTDNISVTQAVNLDTMESDITTNNSKITYPSSASTKLALIGITSSVNLNSLVTQSNANVSDITALENAYPRNTILAWYASQTGNIFFDGNVTFNWDGTNRQLRFFIQNIASNQYVTGGVTISKYPSSGIQISNYLSLGVSTAYKYFTGSQVPANSSYLNTTYNLPSYTRAVYWLQPFSLSTFPTYEISVFVGSSFSYMKIHIKKYNN